MAKTPTLVVNKGYVSGNLTKAEHVHIVEIVYVLHTR